MSWSFAKRRLALTMADVKTEIEALQAIVTGLSSQSFVQKLTETAASDAE